MLGKKKGTHPDLAQYPNHPGYSAGYLGWMFDFHDSDSDGVLIKEEFLVRQPGSLTDR
jgi:hypothetical protein